MDVTFSSLEKKPFIVGFGIDDRTMTKVPFRMWGMMTSFWRAFLGKIWEKWKEFPISTPPTVILLIHEKETGCCFDDLKKRFRSSSTKSYISRWLWSRWKAHVLVYAEFAVCNWHKSISVLLQMQRLSRIVRHVSTHRHVEKAASNLLEPSETREFYKFFLDIQVR